MKKNIHEKPEYDEIFHRLGPVNGKISGSSARPELMKSKLPNSVSLKEIGEVEGQLLDAERCWRDPDGPSGIYPR